MILTRTSFLEPEEKQAVLKLWNQEYPKNLRYSTVKEFNNYLTGLENLRHVLVKDDRHAILGWYSDFKRENEVWFAMILDTSIQGKGIGTRLINKAKKKTRNFKCLGDRSLRLFQK
ncbi:GNAT family N-acetyltransferase [Gillisia marina]|uniref:GNAT family N-acetyltransferase n=1 Tax=Gillisia marina TaxID=1167637 RepID=UPI000299E9B9|nr:GNAT family N-acetyltransferase [Gillisia marina]